MKTTIPTINANTIKALNNRRVSLFGGKDVTIGNTVYWANMTTMGIYAESVDSYNAGAINGYKVAHIRQDYHAWEIVPISAFVDDEE